MILKPSIDELLTKVGSKYSLVVLESKRAHELREGEKGTLEFESVKPTQRALEEIAAGTVTVHSSPETKLNTLEKKNQLIHLYAILEEERIRAQIAKEQEEDMAKQRSGRAKTETDEGDDIDDILAEEAAEIYAEE